MLKAFTSLQVNSAGSLEPKTIKGKISKSYSKVGQLASSSFQAVYVQSQER